MKLVTLNPPTFVRFHQGPGQSIVLQYDEKDEQLVGQWIKDCFVDALNEHEQQVKTSSENNAPANPVPSNVINFPQTTKVVPDTEDDFKPALCLSCEKHPIAHRSGLCNACHNEAKDTLSNLPDESSVNTTENKEDNENV